MSTISLYYFKSELFYRDAPFMKNVSFVDTRKNCYIYLKLVNNPNPLTTDPHLSASYIEYIHSAYSCSSD